MSYILVGAESIDERVVYSGRTAEWVLTKLEGPTIIYADDKTILIFDLERSCLYKLVGWSYSHAEITNVIHEGDVSRIRVRIDLKRDLKAVFQKTRASAHLKVHIKEITKFSPFLHTRICKLLDHRP